MGTKSTMMIRKTPSGSNSSSKTKKIKVTATNQNVAVAAKKTVKANGAASTKHAAGGVA